MVPEHRIVMESILGRQLEPFELVHHINCIKSDNAPKNLVVCKSITEHNLAHASLTKCVSELLNLGVLEFDRDSMSYIVRALDAKGKGQALADAALIARFGSQP